MKNRRSNFFKLGVVFLALTLFAGGLVGSRGERRPTPPP